MMWHSIPEAGYIPKQIFTLVILLEQKIKRHNSTTLSESMQFKRIQLHALILSTALSLTTSTSERYQSFYKSDLSDYHLIQ